MPVSSQVSVTIRRMSTPLRDDSVFALAAHAAPDGASIDSLAGFGVDVGVDPESTRGESIRTWWWIAAGAFVSLLMRLRMLSTPLTADEGGYLAIARAWAHGRVLYRDVWVDRPQGLLVIFRVWDWVLGGRNGSIHAMAVLFGGVLVVSTALVVRELAGQQAARWTAIVCGVISASPVLEAYIPNGEILSGAVAAAGIAICVIGLSRSHPIRWCYAAGLVAGVAISVKQSGFDGFLALIVTLGMVAVFEPASRRLMTRAATALTAGMMSIIAVLMIHAAVTGWSRWWFAVAGYRSQTLSVLNNPAWARLRDTARFGLVVLGLPLVVATVAGIIHLRRSRPSLRSVVGSRSVLLPIWLTTAALSFLIGGGYWRHYWLLLCAPVSALAGVALAQLRKMKVPVAVIALAPCLAVSSWVYFGDTATLTVRATADRSSAVSQEIANWFIAHRQPGDNLYVLCDSPAIYADAHQDPGVAYLWYPEFYLGPHAHERLIAYLTDNATAPRFIAQIQTPAGCDPTGQLTTILEKFYYLVALSPTTILQRRL